MIGLSFGTVNSGKNKSSLRVYRNHFAWAGERIPSAEKIPKYSADLTLLFRSKSAIKGSDMYPLQKVISGFVDAGQVIGS